jgi:hypothetical protein
MNNKNRFLCIFFFSSLFIFSACKEDPALPDNLVQFEADVLGMDEAETSLTVTVQFSRPVAEPVSLIIQVEGVGLTYGTDFTTNPEAQTGIITLNVPSNVSGGEFTLSRAEGILLDGDEQVIFTLAGASGSLVIGSRNRLTVSFSEIISAGGSMEINGGGPTYPNKVFIDLSANRQTAVLRTTWDLAFSTGSDFKVLLNASNGMMARALNKTDLNAVTAADTMGWGSQLSLAAVFAALTNPTPDWVRDAITWIDNPADPLGNPAIAPISANAADNKVYIVNRGTGPGNPGSALGWKKIRILRNGNGYTLQHADIGASSFSEVTINKDPQYGFVYVSLATGSIVPVAPPADRWDIAWSGFTSSTPFNSSNLGTITVPYYFQDIIIQNHIGVETAQVFTSSIAYEDFSESHLSAVDFSNQNQLKIGSSWRSGGGPGSSPSVRTDRFYIVKDVQGNYYKLRFTSLTTDGQRGRPRFEFALVRRGG